MKIFQYIKKLFSKPVEKRPSVKVDPYAPRGKNVIYPIYPNDEFAEEQMEKCLDEIWWKHHG